MKRFPVSIQIMSPLPVCVCLSLLSVSVIILLIPKSLHHPQMTVLNELSFTPSVPYVLLKCLLLFILKGFFVKSMQMKSLEYLL